jgi:hypothetical protein
MKKINFAFEHRHMGDVKRIREIMLKREYDIDLQSCAKLWEERSDMFAAGWLGLPEKDEDVFIEISNMIRYTEGDKSAYEDENNF